MQPTLTGYPLGVIVLNHESSIPFFLQIERQLRLQIADAPDGQKLRPIRQLADELGVSINTVTKAFQRLTDDGIIIRRRGAGYFVQGARKVDMSLLDTGSYHYVAGTRGR